MARVGTGFAAAAALILAACATTGPDDGVFGRKLAWFSYLNAEDIRAACVPGAPDRFRFVYNADYTQHVRTYDVTTDPRTGGASLIIRAMPAGDASSIDLADILGPWRGARVERRLDPAHTAALIRAMTASGVFGPPAAGLILPSNSVYWLIGGCREGHWFVTAAAYPSPAFTALAFVPVLAALDTTGVAFPDPARVAPEPQPSGPRNDGDYGPLVVFTIEIGERGLVGPTHLFDSPPGGPP